MAEFALACFIMLFVTIGPVELAPIFAALAGRLDDRKRRRLALRAVAIAAVVLIVFAFGGRYLLEALGIGFPAFRIAGGVLLLLLAIDLLLARRSGLSSITSGEAEEAVHEADIEADISVFPLAIPLIAGPGAMTAVVLLMGRAGGDPIRQAVVILALLAVLAITLLLMLAANRIIRYLGVTGVNVVTRVNGILLAALAVQFILDGIKTSGLLGPG